MPYRHGYPTVKLHRQGSMTGAKWRWPRRIVVLFEITPGNTASRPEDFVSYRARPVLMD